MFDRGIRTISSLQVLISSMPFSVFLFSLQTKKIKDKLAFNFQIDIRRLGYERVYLPLCKVADTPFHIHDAVWIPMYKLSNFWPLEVVDRGSETQLQMGKFFYLLA